MEFINLKKQYQNNKLLIDEKIADVIKNSDFISGKYVGEFENELAQYIGIENCISCSDGTAALQLIFMAYGIGPGDAVFCPDMTFIASIEPACLLGATPVFCDIDMVSYNLCPESLERQIHAVLEENVLTPKAIVCVDFLGNPANYDKIKVIAKKFNLLLIEDAAQGMGAELAGKKCGTFGDVSATSFFPSKPLGCYGDGGAVFTKDNKIADLIRSLSIHGKGNDKYHNVRIGINSRLDTIQAAVLLTKLSFFQEEINCRQLIAERYNSELREKYSIPLIRENTISSYAQYVVSSRDNIERSKILSKLKENGIPSIVYYPNPLHKMPIFNGLNSYGEAFCNTVNYSENFFGIPFSPYLSEYEQDKVIQVLLSI